MKVNPFLDMLWKLLKLTCDPFGQDNLFDSNESNGIGGLGDTSVQEDGFVAEIPTWPDSSKPVPSPMHGPQPGGSGRAPDARRVCQDPRRSHSS